MPALGFQMDAVERKLLCFQMKVKLDTQIFALNEREETGSLSHLTQGSCLMYSELCYESTTYFAEEVIRAFMGCG